MKRSIYFCAVITIVFLSIILIGCSKEESVKEEVSLVRSQVVTKDTTSENANYYGEVRGSKEVQLAFQISGKITKRNVELGSVVNSGDILMKLDTKDTQEMVNASSAQLSSAKSQLSLATTNLQRYRELYKQGAISRALLDQYQNAYDVALAAVDEASAQYKTATNQLKHCSLIANNNGVIATVNAEEGQVVSAGQPVLTLVKNGEREIEIYVPENRIDDIRNANKIDVSFWALPGVTVKGKVKEISPVADQVSRTYKVKISLITPQNDIKLGMTASVVVANSTSEPSIYVPIVAIYQTDDIPNVWVIKDDKVKLQPIKVGDFGDENVQILDGLHEGDIIVTAGVQKLREGQQVQRYE